ncbi:mRNA 3' end processing factor, partial [Rhizophlyctis rosea]
MTSPTPLSSTAPQPTNPTTTPAAALDQIKQEYRASLQDLTFNSKPIITNLTIIAQENVNAAQAIVGAIEEQMRDANPKHLLPLLYLTDSILKNVSGPYPAIFAPNIVNTFSSSYARVDNDDKARFLRVLQTWRSHPG